MGKELSERIRKKIVKTYPDKFPTLDDLPLENMGKILEENGIIREYKLIATKERFKQTLEESGEKLEGLVLDLCSGKISVASIYDKEKVVCYDILNSIAKNLTKKGIKTVQGSILDKNLPFKDNSFDYLFCSGFPMHPYAGKVSRQGTKYRCWKTSYLTKVIKEIIRVTKKKAIIRSIPIQRNFPKKYNERIEKSKKYENIIVLNCKKS